MISFSDFIRKVAKKISGRSIIFLGTGPSKPIIERSGKSNRKNTSTLLTYNGKKYLIDVPPDVNPDINIDYLLITHLHSDSFNGFKKISDHRFTFGFPKDLEKKILKIEGPWKKHDTVIGEELRVDRKNDFGDLVVTPFEVTHDIIYKYATFGYRIEFKDGLVLVYTSDMVTIPEKAEQYFEKVDLLITDGAGWNASLATHFGMWPFLDLVKEKNWDIKKIYFTQIGRPVPDHQVAQKEISGRYKGLNAHLSYDGLRVDI